MEDYIASLLIEGFGSKSICRWWMFFFFKRASFYGSLFLLSKELLQESILLKWMFFKLLKVVSSSTWKLLFFYLNSTMMYILQISSFSDLIGSLFLLSWSKLMEHRLISAFTQIYLQFIKSNRSILYRRTSESN